MQEGAIGMNVFPSLRNTLDTIKGRNDYIPHEDGDELLCVIFNGNSARGYMEDNAKSSEKEKHDPKDFIYLGGNSSHI